MTTTVDAGTLRRRGLIWLAVVLVVAVLVGAIWLFGGFDSRARPYMGPVFEVGEKIETRFWDFEVHGAEVIRERGTVAVALTATSKLAGSTPTLTSSVVMVRLPDGEVMFRTFCQIQDRSAFSPFVRTSATCQFDFDDNEVPEPPAGDVPLTIIVLDQEMAEELLLAARPRGSVAAGHVELTAAEILPEEE